MIAEHSISAISVILIVIVCGWSIPLASMTLPNTPLNYWCSMLWLPMGQEISKLSQSQSRYWTSPNGQTTKSGITDMGHFSILLLDTLLTYLKFCGVKFWHATELPTLQFTANVKQKTTMRCFVTAIEPWDQTLTRSMLCWDWVCESFILTFKDHIEAMQCSSQNPIDYTKPEEGSNFACFHF